MTRISLRLGLMLAAAALVPACATNRGSSGPLLSPGGTLQLLTRGGAGSSGSGGNGGDITISAKTGSDISILRGILPSPTLFVPPLTFATGNNTRHITGDTTYTISNGPATITNLRYGDNGLVSDDGVSPANQLIIDPGVRLTLPPNDVNPNAAVLNLTTLHSVVILGTLAVGRKVLTPNDGADLSLDSTDLLIGPNGRVDTTGLDNPTGSGGNGGSITVTQAGNVLLQGAVATAGGAGTTQGGSGGGVSIQIYNRGLYSLGSIVTSGGSASAGAGGDAGTITLQSATTSFSYGPVILSGSILGDGGPGTTRGGKGGAFTAQAVMLGGILSLARINVSGGDVTTAGPGGAAGALLIAAQGESVELFGLIIGRGGAASGAVNVGGTGSSAMISTVNAETTFLGPATGESSGEIRIGCSLDVRGGDGPVGGSGGAVTIRSDSDTLVNAAEPGL
ncbi:MAG TPA: hypothetical protein VKU80_09845, partial [Planctomycetota bacterium]|nr:hypothetical protein [Planctomycetota bacterium]